MQNRVLYEMNALAEGSPRDPVLPPPEPRAKARAQVNSSMEELYAAVSLAQGKLSLLSSLTTGNDLPESDDIDRTAGDLADVGQRIQRACENLRAANERFQKARKS